MNRHNVQTHVEILASDLICSKSSKWKH